jgi:hypothetical protein
VTQILLKARPTTEQLRDRLEPPVPDGLELYLDRLDLADADYLAHTRAAIASLATPPVFTWIVEAPIRTLQSRFFDLTTDDADHRQTLDRVIKVGHDLGAAAANIHVVAPTLDDASLTAAERRRCLDQSLGLLSFYVERCRAAGLIPLVENVPPVGRMRENAFVFSPIGAAPQDLLALAAAFPALRFTVDLSHAALYLNFRRAEPPGVEPSLRRAVEFQRDQTGPSNLAEYLRCVASLTTSFHISNAAGLLGEGRYYGDGEEDLDLALTGFVGHVPYFVTETLEPDPARANGMRDAQARLTQLITIAKGAVA